MKAHHLPRFLLNNFAIDDALWSYRKDTQELFKTNSHAIFHRKDLYIRHEFDENFELTGEKDYSVEQQLTDHEGTVDSILKKIIGSKRDKISLSNEERIHINRFLLLLGIRSPDREKHHRDNSSSGEKIKTLEASIKSYYGDTPDVNKKLDALTANIRADKISEILKTEEEAPGISIGYSSGNQFITGSFPCGFLLHEKAYLDLLQKSITLPEICRLEDSTYHGLWIPISPNIALVCNFYGEKEIVDIPNQYVDKINANIYGNSDQITAQSRSVIESVLQGAGQ